MDVYKILSNPEVVEFKDKQGAFVNQDEIQKLDRTNMGCFLDWSLMMDFWRKFTVD